MRAIRAWHISMAYYAELFREISGLSLKEFIDLEKELGSEGNGAFNCTNRLTSLREKLSDAGYRNEVEQTDGRFLAEHRGFRSDDEWETFWADYCNRHEVSPYPKDAL